MEVEGDSSFDNSIGGNVSDVSISFPDLSEKRLQVLTSVDDEEEKEGGNVSDDLPSDIEALLLKRSDLQRILASSKADFEGKFSRMQQELLLKSLEVENARSESDCNKKALEDLKNDLEDRASHLEEQIAYLEMGELRFIVVELNFRVEKERVALMKKEEEVNTLTEALNKWKETVDAEKERRSHYVAKEKEKVTSLEEKLLAMRDKFKELKAKRLKAKLALGKKEEVISFFTDALRIKREKGTDILEIEKKFVAAMTKKEREIVPLKKDLMLANENHELRNNKLEEELKQLNCHVSKFEEKIKNILPGNEDDVFLQNNRPIEANKVENEFKLSWVTTSAIMISTGTVAAAITALCLRHLKQG